MCAVGLLLKYLDNAIAQSGDTPSFSTILELMVDTFPSISEGEKVKLTFCKKNIANLFSPESIVLKDLATIATDDLLNFEDIDYYPRIIALKTDKGINEFAKFLSSLLDSDNVNAVGERALNESSAYLLPEDYNYLAHNYWSVYMSLVMTNPNVLKYSFWVDFYPKTVLFWPMTCLENTVLWILMLGGDCSTLSSIGIMRSIGT